MIRSLSSLFACSAALLAQGPPFFPVATVAPAAPAAPAAAAAPRPIDLVICLDVSGSMSGLINAARQNLWAVVNDLARLQPAPTLRVALLTFGCPEYGAENGFVRVDSPFTTDLDAVSQRLFALTTNGGDEYVARVVQTALAQLQWSADPGALKLLFVAGNEGAAQDPQVDSTAQASAAIGRGIVVNTIYCGNPADGIAPGWRAVAKAADGQFAAIEQDTQVVIATPFDDQLAALSTAMNPTYVPYGAKREVWAENQRAQDGNAEGLNSAAAAQRCQTKASAFYGNAHWDLVDACDDPKFELDKVKKEELPEALRGLTIAELRAHVATQKQKRSELRRQVEELGKQRDAFVVAERQKAAGAGAKPFDQVVLDAVRQQAAARGFAVPAEPAKAPAKASVRARDVESPFTALLREVARDYRTFVCVTGAVRWAPTDCRMPPLDVARSAATGEHGQKLYMLYARHADGASYLKRGEPAKVGQTLVKESWHCVDGEPKARTEASDRYAQHLVRRDGDAVSHAGAATGLFVMHKLAADTAGTDQGWVYGTIDRDGVVTGAGRMASCMRCHEGATDDRRFGLR